MVRAVRRELARWAEIAGLTVVAITQPVLDALGKAPEQFVFRGASATDIVVVAVAVAIVPATVLWLPGGVMRRLNGRIGRALHLLSVLLVSFWAGLQLLHVIGLGGVAKALVAMLSAVALTGAFVRVEAVRTWTRLLSGFALLFVGLFLFTSPAGDLVFTDPPEVVDLDDLAPENGQVSDPDDLSRERFFDIVMIVLDELPTSLLLDESGGIDEQRYPAIAELAADSTWYRSYTTVSSQTVKAIPSILSGQLPDADDLGVWTQRPDTLFRLLGGTYHLTVSEALTRYCPIDWCGTGPIAPPPVDDATAEPVPAAPIPEPPSFDRGGLSGLLGDAYDVWRAQVRLDRVDTAVLTGFEETTLSAPTAVPTTSAPPTSSTSPTIGPVDVDDEEVAAIEQEVADDFLGFGNDLVTQLPRIDAFRSALTPSADPTLYFLHVVLPHQPFIFTEEGDVYTGPSVGEPDRTEWDEALDTERMSMQMQFTDGLLGEILDQARTSGIYDDAMVILMADHGASLGIDTEYRWYDETNAGDLMVAPLFVKAPGQSTGGVNDAPLQSVDLLPTIAEELGVTVPWPVDGRPLSEITDDLDDCSTPLTFVRFGKHRVFDPDLVEHFELCPADVISSGLEPLLTAREDGDTWATAPLARRTPHAELLGVAWDDLVPTPSSGRFTLDDADQLRNGTTPPLGVIQGSVGGMSAPEWVAVAIDGRIAGISPVFARGDGPAERFAVVVPSELLSSDGYDIRVAVLDGSGEELVASELQPG